MVEIAIIDWDDVKRKTWNFFKTAIPATFACAAAITLCGYFIYWMEHAAAKDKARQVELRINSEKY